jgi:hypothetical protein
VELRPHQQATLRAPGRAVCAWLPLLSTQMQKSRRSTSFLIMLSVPLAFLFGFAAQRRSLCAVSAIRTLIEDRAFGPVVSLLRGSAWVTLISLPVWWLSPRTDSARSTPSVLPDLGRLVVGHSPGQISGNALLAVTVATGVGAAAAAWSSGNVRPRLHIAVLPCRLGGGTLIGFRAVPGPGGDAVLILNGIPAFSPHAVPDYLALCFGITVMLQISATPDTRPFSDHAARMNSQGSGVMHEAESGSSRWCRTTRPQPGWW